MIFGGKASVQSDLIGDVSLTLGGGSEAAYGAVELAEERIFVTKLDMEPIFHQKIGTAHQICGLRDAFIGNRWISVSSNPELQGEDLKYVDLATDLWFKLDADGKTRSPGISSPACIEIDPSWGEKGFITATGLDGRRSQAVTLDLSSAAQYGFDSPMQIANPQFDGDFGSHINTATGETRLTFSLPSRTGVTATFGNKTGAIDAASITITLRRGAASGGNSNLFDGSWTLNSIHGTAIGQVTGEARLVGQAWQLRGKSTVTGGSWPEFKGSGGFSGVLNFNSNSVNDDVLNWQIDGAKR